MQRHWMITGTQPHEYLYSDGKRQMSTKNFECHVVADTLIRAAQLVMEKRPTATIYNVTHRGELDYFVDAARAAGGE